MRFSGVLVAAAALVAGFVAPRAWAAGGNPDNWCRNGLFPEMESPALGIARITGHGKVRFTDDLYPECPSPAQRCLGRAYLVPGDVVLIGHARGDYVCAFYPNRQGGTAGWIPAHDLARLPDPPSPRLEAWVGTWRDGDDTIRLAVKGDALTAEGEAFWPGLDSDPKMMPGGPNIGDMGGTAHPRGASVVFEDQDGCRVALRLIGAFLVATDNHQCGGLNVRFDGVYRRK